MNLNVCPEGLWEIRLKLNHLFLLFFVLLVSSLSHAKSVHGPGVTGAIGGQWGDYQGAMAELSLYDNSFWDGPLGKALKLGVYGTPDHHGYYLGAGFAFYAYFILGADVAVRADESDGPSMHTTVFGGFLMLNAFWRPIYKFDQDRFENEFGIFLHFPIWTMAHKRSKTYWFWGK